MRRPFRQRFASAVFAAAIAIAWLNAGARANARSAGYYTEEQAAAGTRLYAVSCSRCHGVDLGGGSAPALVGPAVAGRWPVKTLYAFISRQMPADSRGTLSPRMYDAVVAFLLRQNGHPPGHVSLTHATAATIGAKL